MANKEQTQRKSLRLDRKKIGSGYVFAWNGGGQVPDDLLGDWTAEHIAKEAFRAWNATQDVPVELVTPMDSASEKPTARRKEIQPI